MVNISTKDNPGLVLRQPERWRGYLGEVVGVLGGGWNGLGEGVKSGWIGSREQVAAGKATGNFVLDFLKGDLEREAGGKSLGEIDPGRVGEVFQGRATDIIFGGLREEGKRKNIIHLAMAVEELNRTGELRASDQLRANLYGIVLDATRGCYEDQAELARVPADEVLRVLETAAAPLLYMRDELGSKEAGETVEALKAHYMGGENRSQK